jgi:hypothetical protein
VLERKFDMPYGPGTYGSKVGRPPKKYNKGGKLTNEEKKWRDAGLAEKRTEKKEKELWDKKQKKMMKRSGLTSGPQKRRSSDELHDELYRVEEARRQAAEKKYGDRGKAGLRSEIGERDAAQKSRIEDLDLIEEYGKDAPIDRGYGTPARRNPMKKGGKVKKKKSYSRGGKVRGAGKASQGVRKCKYVSMKGS